MRFKLTLLLVMALALAPLSAYAQLMIIGNDEKVTWDDAGKPLFLPPGKDTVSIVDISNREAPRILASLPLMNSVFGPPTNLQITPDGKLGLVANSMAWVQDGGAWKPAPDTKLYVIDLTANPPAHIATVEVGKQPSGLAINRAGDLALVTNRARSRSEEHTSELQSLAYLVCRLLLEKKKKTTQTQHQTRLSA